MAAAIPFIQLEPKTQRLEVTAEARAYLAKLKGPVGICVVAGTYRTGKSYILNQLGGQAKTKGDKGFGVGSSVQAKTKGIWLWGAPLKPTSSAPGAPSARSSSAARRCGACPATCSR